MILSEKASRLTISELASNTTRRVVGQWGGAGGASCEDHFGVARGGMRVAFDGEAFCLVLLVSYMPLVIVLKLCSARVAHKSCTQALSSARSRNESHLNNAAAVLPAHRRANQETALAAERVSGPK